MSLENKRLVSIVFIALCLRFILFLAVEPWKDEFLKERIIGSDGPGFHKLAVNLVEHNVFSHEDYAPFVPNTHRTPVYPSFLALVYSIFGYKPYIAILLQLVIASLTCIFTYKIGKTLFSEKIAFLAAIFMTVEYSSILYSNYLLADTLFSFIFIIHIYCLVIFFRGNTIKYLIFSAIFLGISTLCRPVTVYFFIFLIAAFCMHYRNNRRKGIIPYVILASVFLLIITPWMIRNSIVDGKFLVSSQQIAVLNWSLPGFMHARTEQNQNNKTMQKESTNSGTLEEKNIMNAILSDSKRYTKGMLRFFMTVGSSGFPKLLGISSHPMHREDWDRGILKTVKIVAKRKSGLERIIFIWGLTFLIFLYSLICCGVFMAIRTKNLNKIVLYILIIAYFTIASASFAYAARYRVPIMPYIIILACYGISFLKRDSTTIKSIKATPKSL
jgi:4-amino-4-deoxy-L-arabinose transferase-like glycosyltransferase